jgi:hypothetical protein
MSNSSPIKTILEHTLPTLQLCTSIFTPSHPKSLILSSATLQLQQELHKALFNNLFPNKQDANTVLNFFS